MLTPCAILVAMCHGQMETKAILVYVKFGAVGSFLQRSNFLGKMLEVLGASHVGRFCRRDF